jgi:sulfatase maturation enzyme AslB (radical SAM superfamily)
MQRLQGRTTSDTRVIHIDDHSVETVGKYIDEYCDVVEEVYFAGGEPLIMPEHYYILEQLIARGRTDVRIRYNTNLSKLSHKHWDVLKLWDKFSNVHIFASLDALGTRAEYIRAGTVWRNIERNIDTILQWRKDSLGVNVTVQASNVWEVPTLLDWLDSRGIEHHKMLISNIVTYPQYYSLQILPQEFKDAVADRLLTHLHSKNKSWVNHFKSQVDGVIQFMNNTPPNVDRLRQQFVNITNTLDKIRNQSFIEECPELAWWWHELTGVSNT